MSIYEYFGPVPAKVAHERCMAYRRAMADASDAQEVFSVLADAAEDSLVPVFAFAQLCDYGQFMLVAFRSVYASVYSDK